MNTAAHIPVTACLEPFGFETSKAFSMPLGSSLAEIVQAAPEVDAASFFECGMVCVNGIVWPRSQWRHTRPKPDRPGREIIVTLHAIGRDGGGGGSTKRILTIVATIALIAVTAFIGGPGFIALFPAIAASLGATGTALLAAGFGVAGSLAIAALAPPPLAPNLPAIEGPGNFQARQIAGVQANAITPLDYVPRIQGEMRVSPPPMAPPYTTFENGVVKAHIVVGHAGHSQQTEIQLNNFDIDTFDDVVYEIRDGSPGEAALSLANNFVIEQLRTPARLGEWQLSRTTGETDYTLDQLDPAKSAPKYLYFKTRGRADRIYMRFAWPSGIFQTTTRLGVPVVISIREVGDVPWLDLPEFHFSDIDATGGEIRQQILLRFETPPASTTVRDDDNLGYIAYGVPGSDTWSWTPESYFDRGGGNIEAKNTKVTVDGFEVFLDPASFPIGRYEVRVKRGLAYVWSNFDITNYTYSGASANARWYDHFTTVVPHQVRQAQRDMVSSVAIESFATYRHDRPFDPAGLSLIALEAFGVQIENISVLVKSIAPVHGDGWLVPVATDCPAALYRDTLTGVLNSKPVATALIDDAGLTAWAVHAAAQGYECNTIARDHTVEQQLQLIAATGWAVPRRDEKWSVIIEKDRSADPVKQMFTPLNSSGMAIERSFAETAHAIRPQINDKADDYKLNDRETVYAAGQEPATATRFETLIYDGWTDIAKARERAAFDLKQLTARQNRYVLTVGAGFLVTGRGERCALVHDAISVQHEFARIKSVTRSGDDIISVTLDASPNLTAAPLDLFALADAFAVADAFASVLPSGMSIRRDDGAVIVKPFVLPAALDVWTPGDVWGLPNVWFADTPTFSFVTPFEDALVLGHDDGDGNKGNLVGIGPLGSESRKCILFSVEPESDLQARLVLVDEAPELHN